jgi:hypothetical protein
MSMLYLKDPEVVTRIHQIWMKCNRLPFFGRLHCCIKFYREFCIMKTQEWKAAEIQLRQEFEKAMIDLQADPANLVAQAALSDKID